MNDIILDFDERVVFALRGLYEQYGYSQYKMSKFEEYDLYVRNKDFLVSDSIITFTDTNGRLMALKPDVTLSIIKNTALEEGSVQKVYYNENVYRASKAGGSFKEIMQVGLECIGAIDDYCIAEVLLLAANSLRSISESCVLDISHLGILSLLMEKCAVPQHLQKAVLKCVSEKNTHELARMCMSEGVSECNIEILKQVTEISGSPKTAILRLRELTAGIIGQESIDELERILSMLEAEGLGDMLRIDFSVVSDISYYNGIVFKGFVEGVPAGVLSGGQYDRLLKKMHRTDGAIGFAVYLDMLERMGENEKANKLDALLLYGDNVDVTTLHAAVKQLQSQGLKVLVQRSRPQKSGFRYIYKINEKGELVHENDA